MADKNKTGKPIDVEALWRLARLGAPESLRLTAQAVATLTRYSMQQNKGSSLLWLRNTLGGAPRRLTACGDKDGQARWSPHGDRIASSPGGRRAGRRSR
ncbi:MAG: hypothetical protein U1F49_19170 [Rubrivivax sp.]